MLLTSGAAGESISHQPESTALLDERSALETSQDAIGRTLTDITLTDQYGRPVRLSDWRGSPLILSLIYTSCYHTCSALTLHLKRSVDVARTALGKESFAVLSVGFDVANDTPDRMRLYGAERGIDTEHWTFASADPGTIDILARDAGFIYFPSPKGFDHLAQTTLIDRDGVIRAQVYGESFDPPLLVEPLKALVWRTDLPNASLTNWVNGLRLFCTVYDPASGTYRFDYSVFVAAAIGTLCLGAIAWFLVNAWRQSGHARKTA